MSATIITLENWRTSYPPFLNKLRNKVFLPPPPQKSFSKSIYTYSVGYNWLTAISNSQVFKTCFNVDIHSILSRQAFGCYSIFHLAVVQNEQVIDIFQYIKLQYTVEHFSSKCSMISVWLLQC